jgi:hypothetical protein
MRAFVDISNGDLMSGMGVQEASLVTGLIAGFVLDLED